MDYISNTSSEKKEMMDVIGIENIEELFAALPEELSLKKLPEIQGGYSELELMKIIKDRASRNSTVDEAVTFMGAGSYDHYIPHVIDHLILRSEFYTAYTPYQAELSQGTLQAIYEYQSMVCELTGMEVSNASLLDGGSAAGEAALMAARITRKDEIIVSRTVHPAYRKVINTYCQYKGIKANEISFKKTKCNLEQLEENINQDTAAVVVQYPNFFGSIEDMNKIEDIISREKRVLFIVIANPFALGILEKPKAFSADIVVGEGQSLGSALNYGGPYLGFMAADSKYLRQMPGRIAGATVDEEGNRGYVLTLQTREQHIRRERATSNICTNEALNALTAAIYLSIMGKKGLAEAAKQCLQKAHYLADRLNNIEGYSVINKDDFFNEFLLKTPQKAEKIYEQLRNIGIRPGVAINHFDYEKEGLEGLIVAVTEKRTKSEMDFLVSSLEVL